MGKNCRRLVLGQDAGGIELTHGCHTAAMPEIACALLANRLRSLRRDGNGAGGGCRWCVVKSGPKWFNNAARRIAGDNRMSKHRIYTMSVASVYPHYLAKTEKMGRTKAEVDEIIRWLTGYSQRELEGLLKKKTDFETFLPKPRG